MPAFAPVRSIHDTLKRGEALLQAVRECTLVLEDGRQVKARDGRLSMEFKAGLGGMTEDQSCRFFVAKTALKQPLEIDSVFTVRGRTGQGAAWKVKAIEGGLSPADPAWIFACIEEHS